MERPDVRFDGSIPETYHERLGPMFFEAYAADLARRLSAPLSGRVLEVACGTGILTRHLRALLPSGTELIATDLSQDMVSFAQRRPGAPAGIIWRQADAAQLPFDDGQFDAVACQFGVMFVPDKAGVFRELRRVLRAGGRLVFNTWDSLDHNPIAALADQALTRFFPSDPPPFYRIPFSFCDRAHIATLLAEAGFGAVRMETVDCDAVSPTAADAARGMVFGTPALTAIRERGGVTPEVVAEALAASLAARGGHGPFSVPMRAIVVEASTSR